MMRSKAGLRLFALVGLFTAALASGACSDEEDAPAGNAGTSGKGGGSGGGSGSGDAGEPSGGTSAAGSNSGGTGGHAGTATGGGGNASGSQNGGTTSMGGEPSGEGGVGGPAPEMEGGAGAMMGGAGGEPMASGGEGGGAPIVFATLVNGDFEMGTNHVVPTGWSNDGTTGAAYYEYGGAHTGNGKLVHWTDWNVDPNDYTARTYQTLDPIENGTYSFSIWVDRGDVHTAQYLFAKGHDATDPDLEMKQDSTDANAPAGYVKITLSGIVVTSGKVTVGVFTDNWAGNYVGFDDAEFVKE